MSEADRIVGNMCQMAGFCGTTTPEVVDDICSRFSTFVMCRGHGRNMVFTPITQNTIAFKTVEFK